MIFASQESSLISKTHYRKKWYSNQLLILTTTVFVYSPILPPINKRYQHIQRSALNQSPAVKTMHGHLFVQS